jgi:hypothetical protein
MLEGYLFNFHCDTQLSDYIVVVTIAEYLRFSDGRRAGLMCRWTCLCHVVDV